LGVNSQQLSHNPVAISRTRARTSRMWRMLMPACLAVVILSGTGTGQAIAATPLSPTATVQDAIQRVVSILRNTEFDRDTRWLEIGRVIDARFDFRSMSQSVLSANWRMATVTEKAQFVEFFSQYLEVVYRTKIEAYSDQNVEFVGEDIRRDRASVDTFIVANNIRVPVTYRLKNNDGEWFVYDVLIEGISLVNNYRNTFSAIIQAEGMEGLLTDLEGRISDYKAKHGGLLPPE
jgi:phospholipid transport system substrate-binding protein